MWAIGAEASTMVAMGLGSKTRPALSLTAGGDDVEEWLEGVTYRSGWTFDVEPGPTHTTLVIRAATTDSRGGTPLVVTHRFSLPSRAIVHDRASFIGWMRHVIGKVELHERDEWLLVDHRRLYDPHAIDLR
jgi:hypothetical protein